MKNNDDMFNLINGLLGSLGNGKPQAESDEQRGIFINRAGGKNIEKIIITNLFDVCQKHSDKIRSQKSAATQTPGDTTSHSGNSGASDLEKNTAKENEEFTTERTRCFDEVMSQTQLLSNIIATENANIIEVMVPGLEKENIELLIEEGQIIVKTSKSVNSEDTDNGKRMSSFSIFDATASFKIDEEKFDMTQIKAEHKNGVLSITVPLKEKPKANVRKVEIN